MKHIFTGVFTCYIKNIVLNVKNTYTTYILDGTQNIARCVGKN